MTSILLISLTILSATDPILCRSYKNPNPSHKIKCYQCDSLENLGCVNVTDPAIEHQECGQAASLEKRCQRLVTTYQRVIRRCSLTQDCDAWDYPLNSLRSGESIENCHLEDAPQTKVPWWIWTLLLIGSILTLYLTVYMGCVRKTDIPASPVSGVHGLKIGNPSQAINL